MDLAKVIISSYKIKSFINTYASAITAATRTACAMAVFQWMQIVIDMSRFGVMAAALGTHPFLGFLRISQNQASELVIAVIASD